MDQRLGSTFQIWCQPNTHRPPSTSTGSLHKSLIRIRNEQSFNRSKVRAQISMNIPQGRTLIQMNIPCIFWKFRVNLKSTNMKLAEWKKCGEDSSDSYSKFSLPWQISSLPVDIREHFSVHFHIIKFLVHVWSNRFILKALMFHYMTPLSGNVRAGKQISNSRRNQSLKK